MLDLISSKKPVSCHPTNNGLLFVSFHIILCSMVKHTAIPRCVFLRGLVMCEAGYPFPGAASAPPGGHLPSQIPPISLMSSAVLLQTAHMWRI